jgi:PhnB protein
METKPKPIPSGYHTATPYLTVDDAAQALDFYRKAFGAVETMRLPGAGGKIGHAEIRIGNSMIMLADESPQMGNKSPKTLGGSPIGILLYVEDVDKIFNQAIAAGATSKIPVENKFYGDRMGSLVDPFGHTWHIGTHVEDVSTAELQKRLAALMPPK